MDWNQFLRWVPALVLHSKITILAVKDAETSSKACRGSYASTVSGDQPVSGLGGRVN